ncbi:MAG: amidohydrolase [Candidatus Aminicenantes bacterium]|nr:amidohydrolase [Candidatus Aminicenantes bacterium]MDH5744308.1 amidohydrolase [Candidatus Aminicenantes bacterium]
MDMQYNHIIDAHTHVGSYRIYTPNIIGWFKIDLDQLRRYIAECNLDKVVLLSHPVTPDYRLSTPEEILLLSQQDERIIPFCTIDPRHDKKSKIDFFVKKGCRGIGEIKLDIPIDHPLMLDYLEYISGYNLPVVVHMSKHWCPNIERFKCILPTIESPMIMHGWGWWNNFNNRKIEEIVEEYDNVYMDISANSGYEALSANREYTKHFLEKHPKHVLYGTDFPMLTLFDGTQFGTNLCHLKLLKSLDLSQGTIQKILYKNIASLIST